MARTATTEQVARALRVGPATVRKYARQRRVPFDTTPGGHRRFDVAEAVAALTGDPYGEPDSEVTALPDDEVGYVYVPPAFSVTVTCPVTSVGEAPVIVYDTDEDQEVWAAETTVV